GSPAMPGWRSRAQPRAVVHADRRQETVDTLGDSAVARVGWSNRRHHTVFGGDHPTEAVGTGSARERGAAPIGAAGRPRGHVRVEYSDRRKYLDSGTGSDVRSPTR